METVFNTRNIKNMIKFTLAEEFMIIRSTDEDETIHKIFQARLNFKAFFDNSNIAEDIEAITDIIESDPQPSESVSGDSPELPPVITIDGVEIKMSKPIENLSSDEIVSRLKICNKYIK